MSLSVSLTSTNVKFKLPEMSTSIDIYINQVGIPSLSVLNCPPSVRTVAVNYQHIPCLGQMELYYTDHVLT